MNALQIAQRLIDLGLAPVALLGPSHSDEMSKPPEKRGKTPFVKGWQSRPCPRSLKDLPELLPEHNVGIRTGAVEGARFQVVVLDEDNESAHWFVEQTQPETLVVTQTGRVQAGWRGQHKFYRRPVTAERVPCQAWAVRWNNPMDDNRERIIKLDVKADGGQVVAPGCRHGTGGLYEEWAEWTPELLARIPVLDLEALNAARADEQAQQRDDDVRHPLAARIRRFKAYLAKCEPSWPAMPPAGAGAHVLGIARAGVWGLSLSVEVAAEEMEKSDWNRGCHDGNGKPWLWSRQDLLHKCRDAAKPGTSDGDMRKPKGWMLDEKNDAERIIIDLTPNVATVCNEVLDALGQARDPLGSPLVYSHAGHLVQVTGNIAWLDRHGLSVAMDKAAKFQSTRELKDGELKVTQAKPPMDIADKLLSAGAWPELAQLRRVSRLPPVTPDGAVCAKPGYDATSNTYYNGVALDLPTRPTRKDAMAARDRLLRYVRALKFKGEGDKSRWFAYLLTLATRTAYDKCPLFLVHAPDPGSGKTGAATVAHQLLYADSIEIQDYVDSESPEWAKSLYQWSELPVVLWDNLPEGRTIRNAKLAGILTSGAASSRELGKHKRLLADFGNTVFVFTVNNGTLDADLSCRSLVIRLKGFPDRDTFRPDNRRHTDAARPAAIRDVFTIVRAWALAGCEPAEVVTHVRYEAWSCIVQRICIWLGLPDPLDGAVDELNVDAELTMSMLTDLKTLYADKPFKARELLKLYQHGNDSANGAVGSMMELCRRRRPETAVQLGGMLAALADKAPVPGCPHLESLPPSAGVARYRIKG